MAGQSLSELTPGGCPSPGLSACSQPHHLHRHRTGDLYVELSRRGGYMPETHVVKGVLIPFL